ncbi:MAG: phosphoribosyltransferase family protein [Candidatus Kariarchaeaceae archaeon]
MSNKTKIKIENKEEETHLRLMAIEIIREYTFHQKEKISFAQFGMIMGGVDRSRILRYAKKENLPPVELAEQITNFAIEEKLAQKLIEKNITVHTTRMVPIVDATKLLLNTRVLKLVAFLSRQEFFPEKRFDKVMTAEVDGLAVAYAFAFELGVPCLYARKNKPIAVEDVLAIPYEISSREKMLHVPANAIRQGEKILVVDDIIRSGKTQKTLIELAKSGGAEVEGLISTINIGDGGKELLKEYQQKMWFIYEI